MNDTIHRYLVEVSVDEPEVMAKLREETAAMSNANMQIGPEQGAFMGWLVRTLGVRRAIEVGTFTGYSALAIARALPRDGRLVCCDVSEEYTRVGERYWTEAGVRDRIDLRIGPGLETLRALAAEDGVGTYDFAFIDADKPSYDAYYEACLLLLRPGGVIAIDNVLWGGSVADLANTEESTLALRALNRKVGRDRRVSACMLPIGDGLTLATVLPEAERDTMP
jgi:predicted O-methyltransferase YrrM